MQAKIVPTLLFALVAATAVTVLNGDWPDRWNPWAPLRLDEPPNALTRYKAARTAADPVACQAILADTPMRFTPLADRQTAPGCGFENALQIAATRFHIGPPLTLSCRAALSLALWERHAVEPAARRHFGQGVARLEHLGSYACRNIAGSSRRSQHASADAIDIAGVVLRDGQRVQVLRHWPADDARGRFLRELRNGACPFFDGVLSPDYNAAHADHLHLDRGPARVCR